MARETHLADVYHRSIGSNGSAIASNWKLSASGTGTVVWTPEGAGSLSYGSNANDVSSASAAGASSLVTRADHVHRGVRTITANGSNSLFGDVNIQAGNGIALSVAGNTITISIINPVGGGGGAAGSPPTFVAAGTADGQTGTISPGIPAGTIANDILLLAIESDDVSVPSAPTGYTAVTGSPQVSATGNGTGLSVFWKRAGGSESAPTVADPGDHMVGQIVAIRGCPTSGDPWDIIVAGKEDTANSTLSATGGTTTVANCLVLVFAANGTDTASADFTAWANADLANVTERMDAASTAGHGGIVAMASGEKAAAGTFGATTANHSSAADVFITIAMKPA